MTATAAGPSVLHALPGRVRVHLPDWSGADPPALKRRVGAAPGIRRVRAGGRTGNVLVEFDPARLDPARVVALVQRAAAGLAGRAPAARRNRSDVLVTHASARRARIAVRGLDREPMLGARLVEHLERRGDVRRVSASPLTGRMLVELSEDVTDLSGILESIAELEPPARADEAPRPAHPLDPGPIIEGTAKVIGTALGLGLLLARRATGTMEPPVNRPGPGEIASAVALLESVPPIGDAIERRIGHERRELLLGALSVVSMTTSGSVLGLLVAGATGVRLLTEATARRDSWREYEERLGDEPPVHAGAVLTLVDGARSPLPAEVVEGWAIAAAADGGPRTVGPGDGMDAGSRVHGGPLTVRLLPAPPVPASPRPCAPRPTLCDRYLSWLPLAAVAYAGATALTSRSPARAATALLLVNPRTELIGVESADRGAAARVLRAGATIAGSRPHRPVRRPDVLLFDAPRAVCDGWEVRTAVAGAVDRHRVVELAGAVAAAAGSPWSAALPPVGRITAEDGTFDGRRATAEVEGERWLLGPADDAACGLAAPRPGDHVLCLRRQHDGAVGGLVLLQPHLSRGLAAVLGETRRHGVRVEIVAETGSPAVRQLAHRARTHLTIGACADRARALQRDGAIVAVVGDGAGCGPGFEAADLAIGLTSGRHGRLMARADVLAPRLEVVAAIVATGVRRDLAVRDGVVAALAANAGGAAWGAFGRPTFAHGNRPSQIGGLATMVGSLVRLRGGHRALAVTERLTDPQPERWGRERPEAVLRKLRTFRRGLTADEAAARWRPAERTEAPSPLASALLDQLRSPLVAVLGVGGILSLSMGMLGDSAMIAAVVAANAAVSAWQEGQAADATRALHDLTAGTALVLRGGARARVAADRVVPGDVLLLAPGERVAADARLIASDALEVDEATLTGESIPVTKSYDNGTAASRVVLEGTDVTSGRGRAVVVAVGDETRMGAIAAALAGAPNGTVSPLDARLSAITWRTLPLVALGGAVVAIAGLARRRPPLEQLSLGASVAIAAVPEGLPLLAEVAKAGVARRLAAHHALVTRLSAVEALGRADVACADKTGTLTTGRLAVTAVAGPRGEPVAVGRLPRELRAVMRTAALASPAPGAVDARSHPTDVAVLEAARAAGVEVGGGEHEEELPFDPSRGFHVTRAGGRLHLKGATEVLAERCTRVRTASGDEPIDDAGRAQLLERGARLAGRGLRVLLVAEADGAHRAENPRSLTAVGFLGISDPLRPVVPEAIRRCRQAGVRVVMLTGDHPATAAAVAREAGLPSGPDRLLTGPELAALDDDALGERLHRATVIARITPIDKLRIVELLRRNGHVVAMTGDGVNDAPALRLADVGVAMGRGGTQVAREAADLILTDDNFATLAEALVEGRGFWRNLRRALGLLFGGNAGEVGLMAAAGVAGLAAPLTTRQVLTVNLLTDVLPAMSIAMQPPDHRDLSRLAREGEAALDAELRADVLRRGVATAVPSFAAYLLAGRGPGARTVAFASVVTTQLAQTLDLGRSERRLNRSVVAASAITLGVVAATLTVPPLRAFLGFGALSPYGLTLTAAAAMAAVAGSRLLSEAGRTAPAP